MTRLGLFGALCLAVPVAFAQSINIPGIGKLPIPGKLGKLLGKPATEAAASAPQATVPDNEAATDKLYAPQATGHDPNSYYEYDIEMEHQITSTYLKRFTLTLPASIPREEIVACTSLSALGNIASDENRNDPRLKFLPIRNFADQLALLKVLIERETGGGSQGFVPAYEHAKADVRRHFNRSQRRYLMDLDALEVDYKQCQERGMLPRRK